MRKKWGCLILLTLLCGCALQKEQEFSVSPFTSAASMTWLGEAYTARLAYGEDGTLTLCAVNENLIEPVTLIVGDGMQEMRLGELSLRLPVEETLPASAAVSFQTALSRLSGERGVLQEDGTLLYQSGGCSLTAAQDGTWLSLVTENGGFTFSEFSFSEPQT